MYIEENAGIGGLLNTSKKNNKVWHDAKAAALAPSRLAFLGLLRLNIWGLATLLSKQAFLVDKATTDSQTMDHYWWDVQKRWHIGWYNLGGSWDSLVRAINAGKGKHAVGIKLAPYKIRKRLEAQGIRGLPGLGGGIGGIDPANLTAAGLIIGALVPLIMQLINNRQYSKAEKKADQQRAEDQAAADEMLRLALIAEERRKKEEEEGAGMMGAGLVGVAILAALFIGTKKSGKK